MRIFDKNDIEIESPDFNHGRLIKDHLFVKHHEAIEAVEEQGHFEIIKEYPNGGKDVKWVVDVEGVEAKDAWDEYEDILRFVEFTAEELTDRRITELKTRLQETDYMILKVVEGAATLTDIADTVKQRAAWRKEINELEENHHGPRS